jgi:hypothetical protein
VCGAPSAKFSSSPAEKVHGADRPQNNTKVSHARSINRVQVGRWGPIRAEQTGRKRWAEQAYRARIGCCHSAF